MRVKCRRQTELNATWLYVFCFHYRTIGKLSMHARCGGPDETIALLLYEWKTSVIEGY